MNNQIRILLADDHPLMLKGLKTLIDQEPNMLVVGEAQNNCEVQKLCQKLKPDLALLDLNLEGALPYEITSSLRKNVPKTKIIVFSANENSPHLALLLNDIEGYILKRDSPEKIREAICSVMQGNIWFSQGIVQNVVLLCRELIRPTPKPNLTNREEEVLRLVVQGDTNKKIGEKLEIKERTVQFHLQNVYDKLSVKSRSAAVAWAVKADL